MEISNKQFDDANPLSSEIMEFAFVDDDTTSGLACLMAAVPFLLDAKFTKGSACRLLKILMETYDTNDGTTNA